MSQSEASATAPAEGLRERNKRAKRERLLRAARDLFAKKGFEGATAREICRKARIGTGTLFLYARDKRELLLLAFEEDARRIFAEGRARAGEGLGLVEALTHLFGAFIEYYDARPELARAIVEQLFTRPIEADEMGALTIEFASSVAALVERAQLKGEVRRDRPAATIAALCFSQYAFWLQAWLVTGLVSRSDAEAALREALELQLEGLCARTRRKR